MALDAAGKSLYLFVERQVEESTWRSWLDVIDLKTGVNAPAVETLESRTYTPAGS